MKHIRNFLVCLSLLAVAGILHHQWLQMSGGSTGLVSQADAASLAPQFFNAQCVGTGKWHFVNPQTGGVCGQTLTAKFSCDGVVVTKTATPSPKCNNNETGYSWITTNGNCSIISASNGDDVPGKIVISDLICATGTPTPTPTPTPTATPTPTPGV